MCGARDGEGGRRVTSKQWQELAMEMKTTDTLQLVGGSVSGRLGPRTESGMAEEIIRLDTGTTRDHYHRLHGKFDDHSRLFCLKQENVSKINGREKEARFGCLAKRTSFCDISELFVFA